MKKIIAILLSIILGTSINLTGCADANKKEESTIKAGKYSATEEGYGGDVTVDVTVDKAGKITDVSYLAEKETEKFGGVAAEQLAEAMKEKNTPNVDSIAGATVTSKAFIDAAKEAVGKSGMKIE